VPKFDCLDPQAPLWGPHFLEASAGTGKTFAIEHIVARLLTEEEPIELGQILVVTFTRAATRELKWRIRKNLEKLLEDPAPSWPYWDGREIEKRRRIENAVASFEECQIYTIHGFCARMLQEFAFETPFQMGEDPSSQAMEAAAKDFFEFLSEEIVSAEQLNLILNKRGSVEALALALQKTELTTKGETFGELLSLFTSKAQEMPIGDLRAEFDAVRGAYKKEIKGDLEGQIEALERASLQPKKSFCKLMEEKGTLFSFLSDENKKKGAAKMPLPSASFMEKIRWCQTHLWPLIQKASDTDSIFHVLLRAWKPIEKKVLLQEGGMRPDDLLMMMKEAVQSHGFRRSLQERFQAVLIDEFQDTDPIQWEIFQSLFLENAKALYLIGDPKQSIYRFRKADLYTYFSAKESMPTSAHFYLDTNFRSSKEVITALNQLFHRPWLELPKLQKKLPYLPMKAGLEFSSDLQDGKGALHCLFFEKEEDLFSYVAREILLLKENRALPLSAFAVLVKDRYAAGRMGQVLASAGIATQTRSRERLADSLAFEAVQELFEACRFPRDLSGVKRVLVGPFFRSSKESLENVELSPLLLFVSILDKQGLSLSMRAFLEIEWEGRRVEDIIGLETSFYADFCHLLELLLTWERENHFTLEGALAYLKEIRRMEGEEVVYRRKGVSGSAVQIMTMHVSKGLEFDIVFCLGLAARTPVMDEEGEAEKLRQFYVAMTRAKHRCYLPFPVGWKPPLLGTASPAELFAQKVSEAELSKMEHVSMERVGAPLPIPTGVIAPRRAVEKTRPHSRPFCPPSYLLSFTALAQDTSSFSVSAEEMEGGYTEYTSHTLPRGADTGILIHAIFERIFSEPDAWKSVSLVDQIIEKWPLSEKFIPWRGAIGKMVQESLDLPLPFGFCLRDIETHALLVEAEFLFEDPPHWVKGFVDLLFAFQGKYYILDWKTNWLGNSIEAYGAEQLQEALEKGQYDLQASLYATALRRDLLSRGQEKEEIRAIYCFVRAPQALCFEPQRYHDF
jgi:exodeoxyribonuclease V beta subunit